MHLSYNSIREATWDFEFAEIQDNGESDQTYLRQSGKKKLRTNSLSIFLGHLIKRYVRPPPPLCVFPGEAQSSDRHQSRSLGGSDKGLHHAGGWLIWGWGGDSYHGRFLGTGES